MEAIISRPKTDAKQCPARKQVNRLKTPMHSDADRLAIEAATLLQTICMVAIYTDDGLQRCQENLHLGEVDHLLGRLLSPEDHEAHKLDPAQGDIQAHLLAITEALLNAADVLHTRQSPSLKLAMQISVAAVVDKALEYSSLVTSAYAGLPATLEDLRALTTFACIKTFRDRPAPPIRRVKKSDEELKDTPAHQAGRTGRMLALQCTWDTDGIAAEVLNLSNSIDDYSNITLEGLLRCYGLRIQALNSQLMAYISQDGTTAGEMHQAIFHYSRPFRGEEE